MIKDLNRPDWRLTMDHANMRPEPSQQKYQFGNRKPDIAGSQREDHFDSYVRSYEERFEPRSGPLCPVVIHSVEEFLSCGRLQGGFAGIRCPNDRELFWMGWVRMGRLACKHLGNIPDVTWEAAAASAKVARRRGRQ